MKLLRAAFPYVLVALASVVLYRTLAEFFLFQAKDLALSGNGGDSWLYVYLLRIEVEKLIGLDGGGLWNGQFFYPLHESSLLFTEPQWGVSVALLPLWLLSHHDDFLTLGIAAVAAMALGWVAAYGFARHLGVSRAAAAVAAVALGTSGAFLWTLLRPFFWPFPLVVLILVVTSNLCVSGRRAWTAAFAILFGILAWSSCHLTVMAIVLVLAQVGFCFVSRIATPGAARRLLIAAAGAAVLVAIPFVPQYLALSRNGFERPMDLQGDAGANLTSLLCASSLGGWLARFGLPPPKGEFVVGLPPLAVAVSTIAFILCVIRARGGPARPRAGALLALAAGALPGIIAALLIPAQLGSVTMNRGATAIVYGIAGAVIAILRGRLGEALRSPAGWFYACAIFFALLSVGPFFRLDDGTGIPSPAVLVCRLPGFAGIRASTRWGIACALCLAISTALAVDGVRSRRLRLAVTLGLLAALVLDAWIPAQQHFPPIHAPVTTWQPRAVDVFLRDVPGPGAVLELPVNARQQEAERMMSRLFHRRLLVNGYGGMIPDFFRDHWVEPTAQIHATGTLDAANIDLMRAFGARFWVLTVDKLRPEVRARVPESFGAIKKVATFDGGQVIVYEDPAPAVRMP